MSLPTIKHNGRSVNSKVFFMGFMDELGYRCYKISEWSLEKISERGYTLKCDYDDTKGNYYGMSDIICLGVRASVDGNFLISSSDSEVFIGLSKQSIYNQMKEKIKRDCAAKFNQLYNDFC